jgi:hypothetical protein
VLARGKIPQVVVGVDHHRIVRARTRGRKVPETRHDDYEPAAPSQPIRFAHNGS